MGEFNIQYSSDRTLRECTEDDINIDISHAETGKLRTPLRCRIQRPTKATQRDFTKMRQNTCVLSPALVNKV